MAKSNNNPNRINFASSSHRFSYPDFLDIQLKSFQEFFQLETTYENRTNEGLFKVFSENLKDKELAQFYKDLMVSEANHYTLFLGYARMYLDRTLVDKKWQELLAYEAEFSVYE